MRRSEKIAVVNFIWFLLILIFYQQAIAQTQTIFKKINRSHGLSSNRITSIIKEKGGFVWIGTGNGLNRYDGKEFKVYNSQNSSIESNNISDLLIDRNGRIWVATLGGGLSRYDYLRDDFVVYKKDANNLTSLPSNQLYTLFEDSKGNLWMGSENGLSLFVEDSNIFITYNQQFYKNSRSQNIVTSIFEDVDGDLWIGTFGGGLKKFSVTTKTFNHITSHATIFTDFIHTIVALNENTLLIGTSGSGLLKFNIKTGEFSKFFEVPLKLEEEAKVVRFLYRDKQNNLWVGSDGNGIIKVKNPDSQFPEISNYTYSSGLNSTLSGNAIYTIMEDEANNLWIGTGWNGVNVLVQRSGFEVISNDINGMNAAPILSILKDDNQLCIALVEKLNISPNQIR